MPRLNAPTILIFILSLGLAVLALINHLKPDLMGPFIYLPQQSFWLAISAYFVLMVGNVVRGL